MHYPFNFAFIRQSVDYDLLKNGIDYNKFIEMTVNTNLPFREIIDNSLIEPEYLVKFKQFAYMFHRFIDKQNLIIALYWIEKYKKTKKARKTLRNGTIKNFVFMNKNKIDYSEPMFAMILKFVYLLHNNNKLAFVLKNRYFANHSITEDELTDIINNNEIETLVPKLTSLINTND